MSRTIRDSDIYRVRWTERDLVRDFPADENFINALHRMQTYIYANNSSYDIPVLKVMNNAHFVLNYMMNLECMDRSEYDTLVYCNSGKDKQLAMITMITLIAMLEHTDTQRAKTCKSVMTEDRSEEFYEGLSLYKKWLENPIEPFKEEDFHIDMMDEINALRAENEQLRYDNKELQKQYQTMEKQYNQFNQYNGPVYNGPVTINNYGRDERAAENEKRAESQDEVRTEENVVKQEEPTEDKLFCRITKHARETGHGEEVEDGLRSASVSAPKLVKAIKTYELLGYLDTQNLNTVELCKMLDAHYGLPFKLRNFSKYRSAL